MSYNVGDIVTLDRIESVIIYKADTEQEWGQYIVVDKNHDLDYYIRGTDYVDQSSSGSATDTHFAEWGAMEHIRGWVSQLMKK